MIQITLQSRILLSRGAAIECAFQELDPRSLYYRCNRSAVERQLNLGRPFKAGIAVKREHSRRTSDG